MRHDHVSVDTVNVVNKAIKNAAFIHLNLTQAELSQIIGTSCPQLSRLSKHDTPCLHEDTKEWECALLFLRIIRSLESLIGEEPEQAKEWLYNYNHHLASKPIDMLKSITGLHEVLLYLDAMRGLG